MATPSPESSNEDIVTSKRRAILASLRSDRALPENFNEDMRDYPEILNDEETIALMARKNGFLLMQLPEAQRNNKEFVMNWLSHTEDVRNIREILKRSRSTVTLTSREWNTIEDNIRKLFYR